MADTERTQSEGTTQAADDSPNPPSPVDSSKQKDQASNTSDNPAQPTTYAAEPSLSQEMVSSVTSSTSSSTTQLHRQRIFKIIVIGDSNVGKTCLTFRFCSGRFPEKTEATIGVDFREKNLEVGGESIKLQIWDTAGQERFRKSMVQHYYRNVHAVVFVYDVTRRSSYESLPGWIEECDANRLGTDVPRILVGNKCDLVGLVAVPTNDVQRFADGNGMPLFETSARDDSKADHVESIFMTVAHKLKNSRPMMSSSVRDVGLVPRRDTVTLGSVTPGQVRAPEASVCVC